MNYKKIIVKPIENKLESSTKNHLLDELLASKNIVSKKDVDKFLNPKKEDLLSPYLFKDMQKAKTRIFKAIENKENILIWGDFDCDGVTSSTILYKALKKLNANVSCFIPNRMSQGHGLNSKELIKQISKNKVKLVITVDCGISNSSEIALLKSFKVDCIITDHHTYDDTLPDAFCIINPNIKGSIKEDAKVDEIISLSYNSGSCVSYKLAKALLEEIDDTKLKDELLIISAVGAIADVVPILGENRALITIALELLNFSKNCPSKPVYTILKQNIKDRLITSTDIAFLLAPRINATGRLKDASIAFDFLNETNDNKLDMMLEQLNNYNAIRQAKCEETYNDVVAYINSNEKEKTNPAIILYNPSWHIGIIGIAASKAVEKYNKPCFLMTKDEQNVLRCSIRSNEAINVYEVLKENEELFLGFGGHKLAGGCSIDANIHSFEKVKQTLLKTIEATNKENIQNDAFIADIELNKDDINFDLIDTINLLEPFGEKNACPIFCMKDVKLADFKTMGKENNHLRITFSKDDEMFSCVRWNDNDLKIEKNSTCDIAFFPRINEFNDNKTIQLEIFDIYSSSYVEDDIEKVPLFKLFDHRKKEGILNSINDYLKNLKGTFGIWAKTPQTKEILSSYPMICQNILSDKNQKNGIMFFDYPSCVEEFSEIITDIKPKKIHFMNSIIDENLENYIRQLSGMIKYCANKLDGNIELNKIAPALGVNTSFVTLCLEILENLNSIEIKNNKIYYLKSFDYEDFKKDSMFEILLEEFENIIQFKKNLLNCEVDELSQIIEEVYIN